MPLIMKLGEPTSRRQRLIALPSVTMNHIDNHVLISHFSIQRLIQEEKQSTEARAEELESRVGSLEHMNLLSRGRPSDRQSPPMSGRSTPNSPNRDYLHKYHTVSS